MKRGIIDNYFQLSLTNPICWTSATIIKRNVYFKLGGFPVGMISGQDSYLWTKIARTESIAFTPQVLANYNYIHSGYENRKNRLDTCKESWHDFYEPGNFYLNEYIAYKAFFVAFRYVLGGHVSRCKEILDQFSYTKLYKRRLMHLKFLVFISPWGINSYSKIYQLYNKVQR